MTTLKQFNFKIPEDLHKQLEAAAKAKGVKMTELVIQGIRQVLNITARSSGFGADLDIYESIAQLNLELEKLNSRLEKLEQSQVDTDQKVHQYIPKLEGQLKSNNLNTDIADDIAQDVYQKILGDSRFKDIVSSIVNKLDTTPEGTKETRAIHDVVDNIAQQVREDSKEQTAKPLEPTQLEFVSLEDSAIDLAANAQKIDSAEALKILKQEDPNQKWTNEKLTGYRRSKKHLGKWHQVGTCQFKYAGEEKDLGKTKHLWWIVLPK